MASDAKQRQVSPLGSQGAARLIDHWASRICCLPGRELTQIATRRQRGSYAGFSPLSGVGPTQSHEAAVRPPVAISLAGFEG